VNRWGHLSEDGLHSGSFIALLKTFLAAAGVDDAEDYSSHSLRRGFASWATANQWDLKSLMQYVGWKDVRSAMRYLPTSAPFAKLKTQ
jgi:integrase